MVEPPADPNGQLVLRFMAGTAEGDFDAIADLVHDDFVMDWPQSGERFSGRANAFAAMRAQRDKPEVAGPPRLVGSGNTWVMMMPLRYGTDILHYVAVLELDDGRIRRATGHWAAPFPAQAYRAEFADRA
jgi:ketosteroid isomerase-like protein